MQCRSCNKEACSVVRRSVVVRRIVGRNASKKFRVQFEHSTVEYCLVLEDSEKRATEN